MLKKLFEFNEAFHITHPPNAARKQGDPSAWGNSNTRLMLQFLYVVSFWCLLRYDEALNIEFHQIEMAWGDDGVTFLKISLPFRKTHQYGGECFRTLQLGAFHLRILYDTSDIQPFFLYEQPDLPHLCPLRAYAEWVEVLGMSAVSLQGPVFRKPQAGGTFEEHALVCVLHWPSLNTLAHP